MAQVGNEVIPSIKRPASKVVTREKVVVAREMLTTVILEAQASPAEIVGPETLPTDGAAIEV